MKMPKNQNPFKYYFAGTQIALTVFVSVFAGYQIDSFFNNDKHIVTITFAVMSIFYVLYALIKDVNKQ
jgi:phage-related holin